MYDTNISKKLGHGILQELQEELGVYIGTFGRAGYGQSDPDPKRLEDSDYDYTIWDNIVHIKPYRSLWLLGVVLLDYLLQGAVGIIFQYVYNSWIAILQIAFQ